MCIRDRFGVAPEGEPNEPLEIDFPLYDESFPDADAEEPDYDAVSYTHLTTQ